MRIGVDTGGTFTDLVMFDGAQMTVHKVRSTPDDPSRAILTGIAEILGGNRDVEVVHGSTVATNAILERKGARVALIVTAGFEDVLKIGRQTRRELYNFFVDAPVPLVEDGLTFGIAERISASGEVLEPLQASEVMTLPARLKELGAESVAVCLLHSYANPIHEKRIAEMLEASGFAVSASYRILPEYREVERWNTTVANAYIAPVMTRYLTRLEEHLKQDRLSIMQSNGGSVSAARAREHAVQTVLSGPAGGAVGGMAAAKASGYSQIITFDMGGTSTDVSLMDGEIGRTMESTISGIPIRLPVIDIHTVGAGGGSIAYVDSGGALRVGPRSAGADPGPICYGKGSELTVTDANLLLGRLDPNGFLGGRMKLDVQRTLAIAEPFATRLGMTVTALAEGIVRIANSNMERAIRVVSVQRGFDPRDFALLAFGGAGGAHACDLADALDIRTVIVPEQGGVLSAMGMLMADVTKDYSQTILKSEKEASESDLNARFQPLLQRARKELAAEGFHDDGIVMELGLDVRYRGQAYEITVPFAADYRAEFDRRHQKFYGYSNPQRAIEVVNLRVNAAGLTEKPAIPIASSDLRSLPAPTIVRKVVFSGEEKETLIYSWEALIPGMQGDGPAIVTSSHSTTVIPPHYRFKIDGTGALIAARKQ